MAAETISTPCRQSQHRQQSAGSRKYLEGFREGRFVAEIGTHELGSFLLLGFYDIALGIPKSDENQRTAALTGAAMVKTRCDSCGEILVDEACPLSV